MNCFPLKKYVLIAWCAVMATLGGNCAEFKTPVREPFYGKNAPPAAGELRWANGELPKTFDPAAAKSPSEIQAVRAIYEGLTEWDAKTLHPVPAAAENWEASDDFRTWTFRLRQNAVWSNGQKVTAEDFVRSWKRLAETSDKSPHSQLLSALVGFKQLQQTQSELQSQATEVKPVETPTPDAANPAPPPSTESQNVVVQYPETWFGAEAVDSVTLRVWLTQADPDFPKLAAHPALRPIHESANFVKPEAALKNPTNGAFQLTAFDKNKAILERSKNYWNMAQVKLRQFRFIELKSEEATLAAYQAGEVDIVTNANFEPLALKLLASYQDFRRTTYSAVTFYEFNRERPHLQDRRVREALAIAIDRERLTNDEMDGASVPAYKFLPASEKTAFQLDFERAKNLLKEAGYGNGKDFPKIKLLINRNETQRRVAKAIAAGWRKNLGVETEIVVGSYDEIEQKTAAKDFDMVRRVVVLPTNDEKANLLAMFGRQRPIASDNVATEETPILPPTPPLNFPIPVPTPDLNEEEAPPPLNAKPNSQSDTAQSDDAQKTAQLNDLVESENAQLIESESQAIEMLPAIPLYFPMSYTLVKPYIVGFDANLLDAHALKNVEIQSNWQTQNKAGGE